MRKFIPGLTGPVVGYYRAGIDSGVFAPGNPEKMAELLHSHLFQFFYFQKLFLKNRLSDGKHKSEAVRITSLLLNGISGRIN